MKALVAGWFSFEGMGATAGDLLARDVVCGWLGEAACPFDVAVAAPFEGGVDWTSIDPEDYSHLFFVCGPFGNGWPVTDLLARFEGARLVGVDLSLLEPLETWNPFELLLERDSTRAARPDISFLAGGHRVPVVGVVLVHPQLEYLDGIHADVDRVIERVLDARGMAAVRIDTRLDENAYGLRSSEQVESVIARMDVVVTTRLHGLVLALKNGVPAVAVDPIRGGAKVTRQAEALSWPHLLAGETLTDEALSAALDRCFEKSARVRVEDCVQAARVQLSDVRRSILRELAAVAGSA